MTNRRVQLCGVVALSLAVTACGADETAETPGVNPGEAVGTVGERARADVDFVQEQLADGRAEIDLGRLAQEKASHPEVKKFGEMMVTHHQQAGNDLRQAMNELGTANAATAPGNLQETDAAEEHQQAVERLRGLSGREFDERYIELMVQEHQAAVRAVEEKAQNDDANPRVRAWASKTLPVLRQHLQRAESLHETLEAGTR